MMKQSSLVVLFFVASSIRGGKGGVSSVVGAFTEEGFSAERRRNDCPALFSGKDCAEVKTNLPECVDGAFSGKWISLHRNVVRFPRKGGERDEDEDDTTTLIGTIIGAYREIYRKKLRRYFPNLIYLG